MKELRSVSSPNGVKWHCLEITTGGSPNAPKGLPTPSSDIDITILLNDKQLNKLNDESKLSQVKLVGSKLLIQGELILDLSYEVLNGDIGVICFQAENLDAKKNMQAQNTAETIQPEQEPASEPSAPTNPKEQPFKNPMELESILIPELYKQSTPREEKIIAAIQYYEQHGSFDTAILLEQKEKRARAPRGGSCEGAVQQTGRGRAFIIIDEVPPVDDVMSHEAELGYFIMGYRQHFENIR